MNPGDYVDVVSQTTLKEEEKLPGRMLKQWKASNDQDNFSTRVKQGPEVHSSAPVTKFMKENYRNIVLQRGPLTPMSRNPSNESMEVVPSAAWEDVSVDDSVDGVAKALKKLTTKPFPTNYLQMKRTVGNTDTNDNIEKLNKLSQHPEFFSFEHHDSFIDEEELKKRIEAGDVDPEKDIEDIDLNNNTHPGIFAGARGFNQTQVHECDICGYKAHNSVYFTTVNSDGVPPEKTQPSTDDHMVTQLSDKFEFLKQFSKAELALLKKEIKQVMDGNAWEVRSELHEQVAKVLDDFKSQANKGMLTREYAEAQEIIKICAACAGDIHGKTYWKEAEYIDVNGKVCHGFKLTSEWRNMFRLSPFVVSANTSNRQLKRSIRCLEKYLDTKYCWSKFNDAVLTTKQIQLLKRGADWMTPLGGAQSKVNMIYICVSCHPNQGAVASNGWYITTSAIVVDPYTGRLTKVIQPKWKCPFCGQKFALVNGARALVIDDRESPDDEGEVIVFPLTHDVHKWEPTHPEYELEKQVEALIDYLRMNSLMNQLDVVNADTIRAAIEKTNYMVVNRLKASCSVTWERTRNIITEWVPHQAPQAKIVSLAPELSLATVGGIIPVIKMPDNLPYPTIKEMAFILTLVGQMVMNHDVPRHTIEGLGDVTKAIPNVYAKGHKALNYCKQKCNL